MFSGEKVPIVSRRWLSDISNAFRTSFCPREVKVRFASCPFEGQGMVLVGIGRT